MSERELSLHRPDLPLRLCRSAEIHWSAITYPTLDSYWDEFLKTNPKQKPDGHKIVLPLPEVVLEPFGPKGGMKRSKVVKAINQSGFTELELMWLSHNLQAAHSPGFKTGVGLYRSGAQGWKPSYYIWGNFDRAGFLGEDKTYFGHYD